jgi:cyclic-di-AMP phosphodiesterase PgpH
MTVKTGNKRTVYYTKIPPRQLWRGILVALIFLSGGILILASQFSPSDTITLNDLTVGVVAPKDILASQEFQYISQIRTEAEKDQRRKAVSIVYTQPDPRVARQQVERLRKIFDFLEAVRADPYGSFSDKSKWIAAIPDLSLSDIVVDQILIMNDDAWAKTRQEALSVLNQAMRTEIRESQVSSTRRQLPTQVPLDISEEQANVIVDITEDLIKPNTFPDQAKTDADRQAAADAVQPAQIKVEQNELIVSTGEVIDPLKREALVALLNLQQPAPGWIENLITPALLMTLVTVIVGIYLFQYKPQIFVRTRRLLVLTLLLLAFVVAAKLIIPYVGLAYLYPIAALAMIVATVFDVQLAFILTTVLVFLAGFLAADNVQPIMVYLIFSGWTGALALSKSQRVNALLWACLYVGVVNTSIIVIFNYVLINFTTTGLILLLEGMLNGVFSAGLALVGLFIIGNLVGIATPLQLIDLARPNHSLLSQLLLKAPASYQHCLMIGNLAEQAAERVGADALLVRVMAYYHDIGKIQRPYFFIENQREGVNVHEKLEPQISAQIIISHVKDGLELAKKYRLPLAITEGISQHHGTGLVRYFYHQALKAAEEKKLVVDEANFRYPGPIPQSKETAILMLADVAETTVRALKPGSAGEIDNIVQHAIMDKLNSGQLDECDLTITDLHNIRIAFVDILQGVHHPRIKYPEQVTATEISPNQDTAQAKPKSNRLPEPVTSSSVTPSQLHSLSTEANTRPASLFRRE